MKGNKCKLYIHKDPVSIRSLSYLNTNLHLAKSCATLIIGLEGYVGSGSR